MEDNKALNEKKTEKLSDEQVKDVSGGSDLFYTSGNKPKYHEGQIVIYEGGFCPVRVTILSVSKEKQGGWLWGRYKEFWYTIQNNNTGEIVTEVRESSLKIRHYK